jgi:hypothetical protein
VQRRDALFAATRRAATPEGDRSRAFTAALAVGRSIRRKLRSDLPRPVGRDKLDDRRPAYAEEMREFAREPMKPNGSRSFLADRRENPAVGAWRDGRMTR